MSIQIFLTGGTIDKHYNQANGNMEFANSHIAEILQQGRNRSEISIDSLVFKDSLELLSEDRQLIAESCHSCNSDKILITHGTDTMAKTAEYIALQQPQLLKQKCIVLVGAMIPHEISYSDATFNLGFALGALNSLENGIYIAMNGKIFNWDKVKKNIEIGEFQSIG